MTDLRIVGAVDRSGTSNFDEFAGIDIYSSESKLPYYDALIVSLFDAEEIMLDYEKSEDKKVFSLTDILENI